MSQFYDQASLVMVPSGYKSGKIYSQKPLSTSGELSFSRASTATRVNASGLIESVASGVPRLDYSGGCPSLLLEPQRTNLVTYSEQIDNASWIKSNSPTITTNIATAPDGTVSADGLQAADAVNYKYIAKSLSVSANSTVTFSFFVKKETSETAFGGFTMYFQGSTAKIVYGIVNAVTGTVTYAASTLTPTTKVEDYGTYWRIASTATDNGSNTLCEVGYYATLSTNGTSLNTGVSSVRTVWGFQAEIGPNATSYIPTLSSAVTRVADAAYKTGISSLIGQTEGTIFYDFVAQVSTSAQSHFWLGSVGNEIGVYGGNSFIFYSSGGVSIAGGSFVTGQRYKIAFAYKANDYVAYVNGTQVGTDTSATVPATSALYVNSYSDFTETHKKAVNQVLLFTSRLSNADLATLTTL